MKLIRKRTISEKGFYMEKILIRSIELREYKFEPPNFDYHEEKEEYLIYLAVNTDKGKIEVDYLRKPTKDRNKFDECFNFLCNYQGISSTLNRIILDIKTDII